MAEFISDKMSGDVVYVVPVFPQRVGNFARTFCEMGRLRCLVTGYAYASDRPLERLCAAIDGRLGVGLMKPFRKRALPGVSADLYRRLWVLEAAYYLGNRIPFVRRCGLLHYRYHHQLLDRYAARWAIDERTALVFGREDGVLASFRRAEQVGAFKLFDMPTAHHRTVSQIMAQEEAAFPGVCDSPSAAVAFADRHIARKEQELHHADHILVGSDFVRRSLTHVGFHDASITVLPSACDPAWFRGQRTSEHSVAASDLVLNVGRLCLRKGTHRLLRVWKRLGAHRTHRLRLIGAMHLTPSFLRDYQGCFEHVPFVDRDQLRSHYLSAACFVMPGAAEGMAGVITEALSAGLPVLASRNSGAEGLIQHGRQGRLYDFADEDQLAAELDWMLSHPAQRIEMAGQARALAEAWTWEHFRARFAEILRTLPVEGRGD